MASSDLDETIALHGDLAFSLGMVGLERGLWERDGLEVSVPGDTGWSQLGVTGGTASGLGASVHRTRLGVEGRYASADGAWTSNLRIGGRLDGGDGETASGAEVSGDVRHVRGHYEADLQGRWYAADAVAAPGAPGDASDSIGNRIGGHQGLRATFGLLPRADGAGLTLALSPGRGTAAGALQDERLLAGLTAFGAAASHSSTERGRDCHPTPGYSRPATLEIDVRRCVVPCAGGDRIAGRERDGMRPAAGVRQASGDRAPHADPR